MRNLLREKRAVNQLAKKPEIFWAILFLFVVVPSTWSASFYTRRLEDPKAVYVAPSGGDDTAGLQKAINQVQELTGQGIVFLAPGQYRVSDTLYIWPSIRLIGYGDKRPVVVLPANTPGFGDASHEKLMVFFAGRRPRDSRAGGGSVPDASPGTFYSAISNLDVEVGKGNPGAVVVRSHYAQHCFLAHMEFRLGSALAGIHEGGNVVEDVHFFGGAHAIMTSKPSPGWQYTLVDCSFDAQREAAIVEREAGLTLIRPLFRRFPTAVEIEAEQIDELWVK
ncbi:MAG: glycosyl hydrolase family 28-related protein, partial [Thermoguttaceae bacterium]